MKYTKPSLLSITTTTTLVIISASSVTPSFAFTSPQLSQHRQPWAVVSSSRKSVLRYASSTSDDSTTQSTTESSSSSATTSIGAELIKNLYNSYLQRDFTAAIDAFANNFTYEDTTYINPITNKNDLLNHFQHGLSLLPPDAQIIIDDLACDDTNGKVGAKWHVEQNGKTIPFSNGCSFYSINVKEGKITEGFKATEMLVKTNEKFANAVVSNAARFSGVADSLVQRFQELSQEEKSNNDNDDDDSNDKEENGDETLSIIEKYYNAWNNRDMELALSYFTENCTVQTEDPIFVRTITGKDDLRSHLLENADSLPSSAKIICDDIAIDTSNGNYGVKWHLEVNGNSLPGLRGCSLCTSDGGLLSSCYDVTEAPVKLPRVRSRGSKYVFSNLMALSSKVLFNN